MPKHFYRLRALRKQHGLTPIQIAIHLHISPLLYLLMETGIKPPPIQTMAALADLYHVNLDYLCGRCDESTPYPPPSDNSNAT